VVQVFSKEDEMSRTQPTQQQAMGTIVTTVAMVLGGAFLIAAMVIPAQAQAFADRKSALVELRCPLILVRAAALRDTKFHCMATFKAARKTSRQCFTVLAE
jgi:hypothetical protein